MKINIKKLAVGINFVKAILWLKNLRKKPQEVIMTKEKKTELWVIAVTDIVLAAMALLGILKPALFATLVTTLGSVYALSRAIAKFTPNKIDDKVIEKIGEFLKK